MKPKGKPRGRNGGRPKDPNSVTQRVLRAINDGPRTIDDLAAELDIEFTRVAPAVGRLRELGKVAVVGTYHRGGRGRPATIYGTPI